jgi:hypothetical protein
MIRNLGVTNLRNDKNSQSPEIFRQLYSTIKIVL